MGTLSDHYLLWSCVFCLMCVSTGLYVCRHRLIPILVTILPDNHYQHLRPTTFEDDAEAGLSSESFSLAGNIADDDTRDGLDTVAKNEVLKIMKKQKVNFDEGRRLFIQQKLARNGIAADGRPLGTNSYFWCLLYQSATN
ncbi:hypothetical protein EDC01DRAFT_687544 [Geopyxis carbonaria]|nr:hypothetical protein EDC01DRAFT_687544 [Geopyxis carbonaria]